MDECKQPTYYCRRSSEGPRARVEFVICLKQRFVWRLLNWDQLANHAPLPLFQDLTRRVWYDKKQAAKVADENPAPRKQGGEGMKDESSRDSGYMSKPKAEGDNNEKTKGAQTEDDRQNRHNSDGNPPDTGDMSNPEVQGGKHERTKGTETEGDRQNQHNNDGNPPDGKEDPLTVQFNTAKWFFETSWRQLPESELEKRFMRPGCKVRRPKRFLASLSAHLLLGLSLLLGSPDITILT